jgi:CTP:molybdopterin cytidylyltransferase MocA
MGSDIPFVSSQTFDQVISLCDQYPAALYLPVVRKEDIERAFPGSQRTYARLKEGEVKAGNLFLFKRENWHTVEAFLSRVVAGRKQLWKLAAIFGLKYVFKFVLGKLTIEELEGVVARATSLPVKAFLMNAPDLGVDVDKPDDLILARAVLEK